MVILKQEECSRISKISSISYYLVWNLRHDFHLKENLNIDTTGKLQVGLSCSFRNMVYLSSSVYLLSDGHYLMSY